MGIEPTYAAWKAAVLPLNYARSSQRFIAYISSHKKSSASYKIIFYICKIFTVITPSHLIRETY